MIEYEISLSVRCPRNSVHRVLQNVGGGITAVPDRKEPDSILLETRAPYTDGSIDFAVNHFLDAISSIQGIEGVDAVGLKVCAFFDPEKIVALNFELTPSTMARIANLGCGFDLWAMPVG
jgi:hypothetical protein